MDVEKGSRIFLKKFACRMNNIINQNMESHKCKTIKILEFLDSIDKTSGSTCFFESISKYLSELLNVDTIIIGNNNDRNQVKTKAFFNNGKFLPNIIYDLDNTPCQVVATGENCLFNKDVQQLFPLDTYLKDLKAEAYYGVSLINRSGEAIGVLVLINSTSFDEPKEIEIISRITAMKIRLILEVEREKERLISVNEELEKGIVERKKIKKNQKEHERNFFEEANSAIVIRSVKTLKVIAANKMLRGLLGYSKREIVGSELSMLYSNDRLDELNEELKQLKNGDWVRFETQYIKKDGHYIDVEITSRITMVSGEKVFQCRVIDNSRKKELERLSQKLTVAVEQSSNSVVITDLNGDIEYVNKKFTDVSGYNFEEVLGKNPRILNSGDQNIEVFSNLWQSINKGKTWKGKFCNKAKDGSLFWENATITPIKNNNGEIVNFLAIKEDVTSLMDVKRKLKDREELLLKAQEIAKLGSYKINLESLIWKFSPIMEDMLGIKSGGFIDKEAWFKIVYEEDKDMMSSYFEDMMFSKQVNFSIEYRINSPLSVEYIWVRCIGEVLIDSKNEPIEVVGTLQNITDSKVIQEQLLREKEKAEEANQLKTEFLNNMSHEIRTPMNGILGFSSQLGDPNLSIQKRNQFVKIIKNSSIQLLSVIDDILEVSRLETKRVNVVEEKVCLNDLLFELYSVFSVKTLNKRVPIYFKKALSDEESTIYTDRSKLIKILDNLLVNALKFTSEGFVEFGYKIVVQENASVIEIYVKDTGVGIKLDEQKNIFERFAQANKSISQRIGGLGLGLSIAKENSELLGGDISLKSEIGKGSTFFVKIPYNSVYKIDDTEDKENKNTVDYTILIAEDDEVNFMILEIYINKLNFKCKVIHAKNGLDAVEHCKNNLSIDLVLMDISMPKMNGYDATLEIRKSLPNLPIIAQTAYSNREDKDKALACGCNGFISKPIDENILKGEVSAWFEKSRSLHSPI